MYDSVIRRSHRGLVADCFVEAFGQSVVPASLSDTALAALLRLQGRVAANFGLYVLACPDTELAAEAVGGKYAVTAAEAVARLRANPAPSVKALLVDALLEGLYLYPDAEIEVERFVFGCIDSSEHDWRTQHTALRAVGTVRSLLQDSRAAGYDTRTIDRWIDTMAPDGSWTGVSDAEAIGRAANLADIAIPGQVVRAEVIDCCYIRYVMRDSSNLRENIARMEARCLHYTDIEAEYADNDIAILTKALSSDISYTDRLNLLTTLFGIMRQLYLPEAEPYAIMPLNIRRHYNTVIASEGYEVMTDSDLLSIAIAAEELADTFCSEEYEDIFPDELVIGERLAAICDELAVRAHRPSVPADMRRHFLRLLHAIGYGHILNDAS